MLIIIFTLMLLGATDAPLFLGGPLPCLKCWRRFLHPVVVGICASVCKLGAQVAVCGDSQPVVRGRVLGRILLFHLVGLLLTRPPVLSPVGLGY